MWYWPNIGSPASGLNLAVWLAQEDDDEYEEEDEDEDEHEHEGPAEDEESDEDDETDEDEAPDQAEHEFQAYMQEVQCGLHDEVWQQSVIKVPHTQTHTQTPNPWK